jgi:hypothetical protein
MKLSKDGDFIQYSNPTPQAMVTSDSSTMWTIGWDIAISNDLLLCQHLPNDATGSTFAKERI